MGFWVLSFGFWVRFVLFGLNPRSRKGFGVWGFGFWGSWTWWWWGWIWGGGGSGNFDGRRG